MPVITLNDIAIRALKPTEGKHVTYIDKTLQGFGVRVTADGFKSYVLIYGKERKRVTLGHVGIIKLAEAREKAKDILADRQLNGSQPARTTEYGRALKQFLKSYAEKNKPSTVTETERLLTKHMPEVDKLHELTKALLVETLDDIEKVSERRHFYTAAHTFFRWCRRYDLPNPLEGVEKGPKSPRRTRLITPTEFITIWRESLASGVYGRLVRCLLISGQRLKQISHLEDRFIDRGARTVTWPKALMKGNRDFLLPYSDLFHSQLPNGDSFLFTTEEGKPFNNWSNGHKDLEKACGIPHFTRHDCRRFYSSTHSAIGTPPHIRERLLGHVVGTEVERTYDLYEYVDEKREAQARYEAHIQQLLDRSQSRELVS